MPDPEPTAYDLCELEDIALLVPGYEADEDVDASLQAEITATSIYVLDEIGREFVPRAENPDTRVFELDMFDLEERELEIGDLGVIDEDFEITISSPDGTVLQTLQEGAYTALPRNRKPWKPITGLAFPVVAQVPAEPARLECGRIMAITGNWGFVDIPPDVKRAVAKLVLVRYVRDVSSEGTPLSDKLDVDTIDIGSMFKSATEVLESWRFTEFG